MEDVNKPKVSPRGPTQGSSSSFSLADVAKKNTLSFPSGMKSGASVLSGLGAKGVKAFAQKRQTQESESLAVPGQHADQLEVDMLREQLQTLRKVYESALDEQRQSEEAHQAELTRRNWRKVLPAEIRQAVQASQKLVQNGCRSDKDDSACAVFVDTFSDSMLERIANAIIDISKNGDGELLGQEDTSKSGAPPPPPPSAKPDEGESVAEKPETPGEMDEVQLQMLQKISEQQMELERLRATCETQQSQIFRLTKKVSEFESSEGGHGHKTTDKINESKKVLESKAREAEQERDKILKELESLKKRLEESEENSRQSYELRCNLHSAVNQLEKREKILDQLQNERKEFALVCRERIALAAEDSHSMALRALAAKADSMVSVAITCGEQDINVAFSKPEGEESYNPAKHEAIDSSQAHATKANFQNSQENDQSGPDDSKEQETQRLQAELEELRIEKALFEKRMVRELQELKTMLRKEREEHLKIIAANEAQGENKSASSSKGSDHASNTSPDKSTANEQGQLLQSPRSPKNSKSPKTSKVSGPRPTGPQVFDLTDSDSTLSVDPSCMVADRSPGKTSSSGGGGKKNSMTVPQSAEIADLLYVQTIAQLEHLNGDLAAQLESLKATERCLRQDNDEKNALISKMLQKVRRGDVGDVTDSDVEDVPGRRGAGRVMKEFMAVLIRSLGRESGRDESHWQELNAVAQEAMTDNMRLKKDLQTLAEELRKADNENKKLKLDMMSSAFDCNT